MKKNVDIKLCNLGYGKIKNSKLTKAMKGFYAKKNTEAKKKLKEFRVKDTELSKKVMNLVLKYLMKLNLLIQLQKLLVKVLQVP